MITCSLERKPNHDLTKDHSVIEGVGILELLLVVVVVVAVVRGGVLDVAEAMRNEKLLIGHLDMKSNVVEITGMTCASRGSRLPLLNVINFKALGSLVLRGQRELTEVNREVKDKGILIGVRHVYF